MTAGVISAVKRGTTVDYAVNALALWGISTPNFWLGILLIFLFAVHLGWLPASGYVSPFEDFWLSLQTTILPAFVLGNSFAAVLMRHTRSAMLQAMGSDYVRTARAKGLAEPVVILKHAMRNALTPVVTLGALELGTLLSGAVLTEQVFSIPGFGNKNLVPETSSEYDGGFTKTFGELASFSATYFARRIHRPISLKGRANLIKWMIQREISHNGFRRCAGES